MRPAADQPFVGVLQAARESAENLALMRRMDALSLQYPFYGSRQMARHLRREGVGVGAGGFGA